MAVGICLLIRKAEYNMKIGVRAHDYGKMKIEDLARTLHETGYECAQLALPKAFIGIDSYENINLEKIDRIRNAFEKYQVEIPVMGCYMDLGNPDDEIRAKAHLRSASPGTKTWEQP